MAKATNTLHVMLPSGMDMHTASAAFGRFGDVARVEVLPLDMSTAVVSFFDARAATRAMQLLGADWCWPGDQYGERKLQLPGTLQLSADDLQRMSSVRRDPAGGDGYEVEFFDVRDAARVSAMHRKTAQAIKVPKAPEQLDKLEPVFVTPLAGFSPAAASRDTTEQTVLLQGLPNALCSQACLEAMIQQAGLQREVLSHSIRPGSPCGEAVLRITGRAAVARCMKHFHGRAWDSSGILVSATKMAPPPGLHSATTALEPCDHLSAAQVPRTVGVPPATKLAPMPHVSSAKVAPPPGLGEICATKDADTEESTDAGASEADDNQDEYLGEVCSAAL